jgi:hypothetical protein
MNSSTFSLLTSLKTSILRQGLIVNPSPVEIEKGSENEFMLIELVGEKGFFTALVCEN